MPGPKSGVHGLACAGREGSACTKVVLQSRVRNRLWYDVGYAVLLPKAQVPCVDLLAALRLLLFGLFRGLPVCLSLSFGCCLVAGRLSRPRLVAARGGRRVCPVWLGGGGAGAPGSLGLPVAPGSFSGSPWDFVDLLAVSVFGPFYGIFSSCGVPARWRDLLYVVPAFAASSFIQEAAERRGLHGPR